MGCSKNNGKRKDVRGKKKIRLLKELLKAKQYELPEEAAGLSVVLTVRYICKAIRNHLQHLIK